QVRSSVMDVLMKLPPEMRVLPGHTDETTIGREWEQNPFVVVWRGADPEGTERVRVGGEDVTLIVWSPDYDGGGKAWVRYADRRAHAPAADHLARDVRQLLEVVLRTGREHAVHQLLGRTAAERDLDQRPQVGLLVAEAIVLRRRESHSEGDPAGDDRDLADRVGARRDHADDCVTRLVIGGALSIGPAEHDLPLRSEHD